jgi:hypothetical protein
MIRIAPEPARAEAPARVTRDVDPATMGRLLAAPPRATVAFVGPDGVELLPVKADAAAGGRRFAVGAGDPDLDGREVVVLVDGGAYWFDLCGVSVRGPARRDAADGRLVWYAVDPRRELAWSYDAIRDE